jgi:O-antigen/teichoic acid export membrane protein
VGLAQKVVLNASALAVGRLLMGGIGVVTLGISTRYLGLEAYGQLATALALMSILGVLTDLGMWTIGARELARRPEEKDRLMGGILTIGFLFSLLSGATAVVLAFTLYGGGDNDLTRQGILLLLLSLPLTPPFGAVTAYFISQQKAYLTVLASLANSLVTLAVIAVAALLDLGFTGLILAYPAAGLAQGAVMIALAWGKVRLRPSLDLAVCRQLLGWAMPIGGAVIVHSLYWRVDIILLSLISSNRQVALYALAFKIVDVVMVLPNYLHLTVMPELARVAGNRPRFDQIMRKTSTALVVGAIGLLVLFVGFAHELTTLAGGSQFEDAAPVLQILAFAVAFAWFGSIFGDAFLVHDKLGFGLIISTVVLPVNVALNVAFINLWGAQGAAAAWVLSEVLIVLMYLVFYRRIFGNLPLPHRASQILAAACAMAVVALLKLLPGVSEAGPVVILIAGGGLCAAVYIASLYALKAMPREVHVNVVLPLVAKLRPR